ncbi:hypothetical protein G3N55_07975 [Dissulfurirhabdus thermomarina]|uniref:Uncharacterized protein n=1 Tax=Dissulfurirhabdus thermomarina TaxID=1765737 RepID=A0A6N9TNZ0_DISTH|nr:hypothetical protein [Dissulfurirhabdus thermomarina]NDY42778.1 hypothetical protein [Dissulfurirhabdus thermomarina]NMX22626.1 hypothetical protein [Dissulfurirhabdus thermomarina]
MMHIDALRQDRRLVNEIDWSMTPEKAVDMYLEWGAGWTRGKDFVRGANESSLYFVIYDWERPPQVTLLRRDSKGVEELAKVPVPEPLFAEAVREAGRRPGVGVHALNARLQDWLRERLAA